ncbi:hypothetical protein F5141DRAFT_1209598 [Pisolithus sp. B1]|nr:hypothetical protein F5141DRAFT_1209598 [Pisolithus sp. B1]
MGRVTQSFDFTTSIIMKPFSILKRGLTKLQEQIQSRKAKLIAELKAGQPISEVDEEWLDGDGNVVDEEQLVETLDNASDYDQGVERLNSQDKGIVQKLQRLGGGDAPSKIQGLTQQSLHQQNPGFGTEAQTHRWYRFFTDQVQTPTDPTDPTDSTDSTDPQIPQI